MFSFAQLFFSDATLPVESLTEGVHDPGMLKCVFMAGGPGSGKSYAANDLFGINEKLRASFSTFGLKVVNNDVAFEYLLKQNGVDPAHLAKIERENPELWQAIAYAEGGIRDRAKKLTVKKTEAYEQARLGMILDGTGDDYEKIAKKKARMEALGYDCILVFVNTKLEVALERNQMRDRKLPDSLVKEIWNACQENIGKFQHLFGRNNMIIVDKSKDGPIEENIHKIIRAFMRQPAQNPIGRNWIQFMGGTL